MTNIEDIKKTIKILDREEAPIFSVLLMENGDRELIYEDGKHSGFPDIGSIYTAGFFYDINDAVRAVEENAGDIRETMYNAAFVLCLYPGLYQSAGPHDRLYFVWDEESRRYTQREEPKFFEHIAL